MQPTRHGQKSLPTPGLQNITKYQVVCTVGRLLTTVTTESPTTTTASELTSRSADDTSSTQPGKGHTSLHNTSRPTNVHKQISLSNNDTNSWENDVSVCVLEKVKKIYTDTRWRLSRTYSFILDRHLFLHRLFDIGYSINNFQIRDTDRGREFESHQDRCRVIALSKLFTLMVLRPTQPSIPLVQVNKQQLVPGNLLATKTVSRCRRTLRGEGHSALWGVWRAATAGSKSVCSGNVRPLIALRRLLLVLVSTSLRIVNRCCSGFPLSGGI